jgi:serine/threonine protein kinase
VIGRQLSHFYLIRTLGAGGMGVVYEAQDTRLPRSVAIKVIKEDLSKNLDAVRRFKREARLASSLNHPNICTILDVGDDGAQSFIAMELLEGASLKSRLLGGPLSTAEIVDIARQVADALGAAHGQGIIHRDITPGNIFLTTSGLVKLLDFGLAKHFPAVGGDGDTDELTSIGAVAGTIHYMSP